MSTNAAARRERRWSRKRRRKKGRVLGGGFKGSRGDGEWRRRSRQKVSPGGDSRAAGGQARRQRGETPGAGTGTADLGHF